MALHLPDLLQNQIILKYRENDYADNGSAATGYVQRAKELGYKQQRIADIYEWNKVSKKCFTDLGFVEDGKTEKGSRYRLEL